MEKYFIPIENDILAERLEKDILRKSVWKHVSIISKRIPLLSNLSVEENISLPISYFDNLSNSSSEHIALNLLKHYNLAHITNIRPDRLSSLEVIKVLYLRAIIRQPVHTFFIKPSHMIESEMYDQFVEFIKNIDDVNISIVDDDQYFLGYYSHICSKASETKWQELVLKTLK